MNYLAHCFLAQQNVDSIVGNLLGDFCKSLDESTLSAEVHRGLLNHRAVDRFTDTHPRVIQAKSFFSTQRRRFAGIALDVLFDHFLIKHWHLFSETHFSAFKKDTYHLIQKGQPLMPKPMKMVMSSVVKNDWFASYEQVSGIGHALDRIAMRIRFRNNFSGSIEDINCYYQQLDATFLQFFPELIAFNEQRNKSI